MGSLDGWTALVTGGGGGIGRAICRRLACDGARVVVADMNRAAAEETVQVLAEGSGLALVMDITDYTQVCDAIAGLAEPWSTIDVLINNAGWDEMKPFVETRPEFWTRVIDINLRGAIHCTHAVIPGMIARGRGRVIFISSDAARVGSTGEAVYAACKGGQISFAKALAREVARQRINVNVVCPGPTDTPLLRRMAAAGSAKLVAALERAIPFGRLAQPEEIAAAVAFFASRDSDFVTGQVLSVSGGLTMAG